MKCPACKTEMACTAKDYLYEESGLKDVILADMDTYTCPECNEEIINIPAVPELHNVIGKKLLEKETLLDGAEIRFLRKNMGLTATRLAQIMGSNSATISRWEAGRQPIGLQNDRMLRLIYASMKGVSKEDNKSLIENAFTKIKASHVPGFSVKIHSESWSKTHTSCTHLQ